MLTAVFGSPRTRADSWRMAFANPSLVAYANHIDEVDEVIKTAEEAALGGSYAVLMLTYEAAPAFDSALNTHSSNSLPLAWAAVFEKPTAFPSEDRSNYVVDEWEPLVGREQYDDAVRTIHQFIREGATYQVNYSFPLVSKLAGDPYSWYLDLCRTQDAGYSVFLNLGDHKVISLSPELFFSKEADKISTRPMKGTARRGRWQEEDQAYALALANSSKDRAENVMIVDLLRNDLGRVSQTGSVHVSKLFELERFETLWQMTSTVKSRLRDGARLVDLIAAVFPCGSITGAPKIRTMEIIRNLEPNPRGIYTGTIGLIRPGGDCTFNVAIRTIALDSRSGTATFGVGGGITIDSTAEREYDECLVKSTFLRTRPVEFDLFESLLLEDGEYFLLERHLDRLSRSADYFGFELEHENFRQALAGVVGSYRNGSWKVKGVLHRNGELNVIVEPLDTEQNIRRLALASRPVDSSNRFLFHKTTQRDFYMSELAQRPDCDDIIFWNERGEVTESSIANVVVRIDDKLYTPPIESGLLAGTYRDQMIAEGRIEVRTILVEDLNRVQDLLLVNSVRKWMPARLITGEEVRSEQPS